MAAGQSALLPSHPLACTHVKVPTMDSDVLTNVENDSIKAALRQLALQTTVRIVQPAPVDLPRHLVDDLDAVQSFHALQLFEGFERGLHESGLPAMTLQSNHQLV